ncbi:MAG: hypothetical protein DRG78_01655 [Epsilonproteobacteria bacterium]|nr:MAG: hypothetical protein DRG78_01655 [Campylobacterota bacterium]
MFGLTVIFLKKKFLILIIASLSIYANGTANEDSDLDIFLIKDNVSDMINYEVEAKMKLRDFMINHKTNGIDILSASSDYLKTRDDYFYKEILDKGRILYEQKVRY